MNFWAAMTFRCSALGSRLRAARLRFAGIQAANGCRLGHGARVALTWSGGGYGAISLGDGTDIREHAVLESWGGTIRTGRNVFVGPHAVLYGHGGIEIGEDTLLSMHVCILSSNHALPAHGVAIRTMPDELRPTRIGRDVWIGAAAVVLGGVTLGDGCVVGAGAVVTKSLPPGAIAIGTPAKVVRWRPGAPPVT